MFSNLSNVNISRMSGGKSEVNATALIQIVGLWALFNLKKNNYIKKDSLFLISLIIIIISVVLTVSRGGLLALLSFLLIEMIMNIKNIRIHFNAKIIKYIIFIIIILALLNNFSFLIEPYYNYLFDRVFNPSQNDVSSANMRLVEAKTAFNYIKENPEKIFFGIGLGFTDNNYWPLTHTFWRIHITYVSLIVENGIFGTVFLFFVIYHNIINKRVHKKILLGNISILIAILVSSLTIYTLYLFPVIFALFYPSLKSNMIDSINEFEDSRKGSGKI